MIKGFKKVAAGMLACTALMQAQVAQAQDACVAQQDLSDAVVYSMPILFDAFAGKCSGELSPSGFVATQGDAFVQPFFALQEQSWPGAARVLDTFAKAGASGSSGMPALADIFSSQSPDTVRPFIDAMIGTMIAGEIKTKDCSKVERGLELMAPLPPENMGGLITFIADMADVKKPELCPFEGE